MDVTDAYMAEVITGEEVLLDVDETEELKTWIGELASEQTKVLIDTIIENAEANDQYVSEDDIVLRADDVKEMWIELCIHSFMAGRAYQTQFGVSELSDQSDMFTRDEINTIFRFLGGDQ